VNYRNTKELIKSMSPETAELNADKLQTITIDYASMRHIGALGVETIAALENGTVPLEHDEQVALFAWAAEMEAAHPELAMLHATPNGGYRPMATAAKLKAEGVKAGYPDISLDVARGRWHGLRIELKRADKRNHASEAQQAWIARLRHFGYMATVCYGCAEAQQIIMAYLGQEG
jgi:hypothetical protein